MTLTPDSRNLQSNPDYIRALVNALQPATTRQIAEQIGVESGNLRQYLSGKRQWPYSVQFCLEVLVAQRAESERPIYIIALPQDGPAELWEFKNDEALIEHVRKHEQDYLEEEGWDEFIQPLSIEEAEEAAVNRLARGFVVRRQSDLTVVLEHAWGHNVESLSQLIEQVRAKLS